MHAWMENGSTHLATVLVSHAMFLILTECPALSVLARMGSQASFPGNRTTARPKEFAILLHATFTIPISSQAPSALAAMDIRGQSLGIAVHLKEIVIVWLAQFQIPTMKRDQIALARKDSWDQLCGRRMCLLEIALWQNAIFRIPMGCRDIYVSAQMGIRAPSFGRNGR